MLIFSDCSYHLRIGAQAAIDIEKALRGLQGFEIDLRCHTSVHKERRKISQPRTSLVVKLCTKLKPLYLTVLSPFLRDAFKC